MRGLLLLLLAATAWGQKADEFSLTVDQFKGQNTYIDSARLPNGTAQSAYNVLTEHGYVEKRTGSVLATTFGASVGQLHEYVKAAGSRLLMGHAGANVLKTDLGSAAVLVATVTAGTNVDFVSAFNKVVFVDGYNEVEYDGASTTTSYGFPGCKLVEFDQNRIWCANILAESQSMVRISSAGGTSWWTVPANVNTIADAPNYFYIQRDDGQPITCMKKTPWGMVVGKGRSMWVIKGYDNRNWYILNIDPAIGCADDRSMQMIDGRLQWLGKDGVYSWQGAGPAKVESLEVDSIVKAARQSTSQTENWALDSQSDWLGGTLDFSGPGAKISAAISPGNIVPSTWSVTQVSTTEFSSGVSSNIDYSAGTIQLSSNVVQENFSDGDYASGATTWTVTSGVFDIYYSKLRSIGSLNVDPRGEIHTTNIKISSGNFNFSYVPFWQGYFENVTCTAASGCGGYYSGATPALGNCFEVHFKSYGDDYYAVNLDQTATGEHQLELIKYISGVETILSVSTISITSGSEYDFSIRIGTSGQASIYVDDVFYSSATDTNITQSEFIKIEANTVLHDTEDCPLPYVTTVNQSFGDLYSFHYKSSASYVSRSLNTGISTTVGGPFISTISTTSGETEIDFYIRDSSSSNNDLWSSWRATSDTLRVQNTKQWWQYKADLHTFIPNKTPYISGIGLSAATTAWYLSPVHYIGVDISSYGSFDVGQTMLGLSSVTYQVRQATYTFLATATSPGWSAQTANASVSLGAISTPTYFQWRGLLLLDSATAYPTISVVRTNWITGEPGSLAASGVLNHRYFLCLAVDSANNDTCLVQQQTRDWVVFGGQNQSAMTIYNNELFAGSPDSTGKVWRTMQDGVYNDDGTAINAHWTSPDYMFGDPVGQKAISEMWMDAQMSTGTILNVSYSVNKSTTMTSKNIDLGTSTDVINRRVPIDKGFALGKYFRLKFSNSQDKYFRVNGFTLFGQSKPRTE